MPNFFIAFYIVYDLWWQAWEMVDAATTRVTLQKLQRGQEYQFRVIAVNKAGKSEPGHPSRPKLAKETDCEYLFSRKLIFLFVFYTSDINAKVATVLGSIPASSDTMKSEERQMKQC
jgi:hypothetical protein